MKKIYAIMVAALMSASMYAAAPTEADLANEYDLASNVVFCIHFVDEATVCNDIRFVGTPNNWAKGDGNVESFDNCEKFKPVEGFDGWYAAELPYSAGFEGKPVQETPDRVWAWDYQCGDVNAWEYVGGNTLNITPGYSDECNIAMPSAGAYIYELKYWKKHKTPCAEIKKHDYTIILYAPDACPEKVPGIAGDFNGWKAPAQPMTEDLDEDWNTIYTISFNDQEGHGFKIREASDESQNWDDQMQEYVPEDEEEDVPGYWKNMDNIELGEEEIIVLQWSDNNMYRFGLCGAEPVEPEDPVRVYFSVILPQGVPAAGAELVGGFGEGTWDDGLLLEFVNGRYATVLSAKPSDAFKVREAGSWLNQIQIWKSEAEEWKDMDNQIFKEHWIEQGEDRVIELDWSDPAQYKWTATEGQGIEEVVLTEKANKVMVDGVLYIVRDNKMFNVTGTQVR